MDNMCKKRMSVKEWIYDEHLLEADEDTTTEWFVRSDGIIVIILIKKLHIEQT